MSINLDSDLSQGNPRSLSSNGVRVAGIISALTAVINAILVVYHLVELRSRIRKTSLIIVQIDPPVSLMHIRIALALLLAAVCLMRRRVVSLLISVVALIWVLMEYGGWYLWSASIRRETGIVSPPGLLGLYGANVWHVAVMAIVLALVIWETKILFGSLRSVRR